MTRMTRRIYASPDLRYCVKKKGSDLFSDRNPYNETRGTVCIWFVVVRFIARSEVTELNFLNLIQFMLLNFTAFIAEFATVGSKYEEIKELHSLFKNFSERLLAIQILKVKMCRSPFISFVI